MKNALNVATASAGENQRIRSTQAARGRKCERRTRGLNPNWIQYEDSENSEKATGTPITSAGGEWVEAPEVVSVTAQVCSTRFASEWDARMELWRNAQHKHPQKSDINENSHRSMHGRTGLHRSGVAVGVPESARLFF